MVKKKSWETFAVLAASIVAGYLGYEISGAITMYGLSSMGLTKGMATWPTQVLFHPFTLYGNRICILSAMLFALAPFIIWAFILANRGNFDPGRERGDARMATRSEIQAMRDNKTITNNIPLTQNAGICLEAKDERMRKAVTGLNRNVLCLGTSGTGKTFNVSKPMILNAVGSALKDEVKWSQSYSENDEDAGYDLFVTDPKGSTLRDTGWMLAKAGFTVKAFNTINLAASRRYNPLAYIKTYQTDVVADPKKELSYSATLFIDGQAVGDVSAERGMCYKSFDDGTFNIEIAPEIRSESVSAMRDDATGTLNPCFATDKGHEALLGMRSVVYRRSSVTFNIRFSHKKLSKQNARIEIELDDNLIPFRDVDSCGLAVKKQRCADGKLHNVCHINIPGAHRISDVYPDGYEYRLTCRVKTRYVADGVDLTSTVDALVANLGAKKDGPGAQDPFWDDAERLYFMAIIALIIEQYGASWCNLPTVVDLMDLAKVSFDGAGVSPLDCMFDAWESGVQWEKSQSSGLELGDGGMPVKKSPGRYVETQAGPHDPSRSLAVHCYKAFKQGAPETLQSIIISCASACVKLVTEEMRWLLGADEMELDTMGNANQKQAIFAITSDTNPTYEFLLAIMQYQAINLACDRAGNMPGEKLPRHVHFVLDEFANIGKLPAFDRAISVVRSRNMSVCLFLQSVSQLNKVYGEDEAKVIKDNCATMLFLGGQSEDTLKSLSELMGDETVDEVNTSKTYGMRGQSSSSRSKVQRKLVTISQLRTTSIDEAWVLIIGKNPYKDAKVRCWEHPYFCFTAGSRAPGQAAALLPPFDYDDYRKYLAGDIPLPVIERKAS